jgi:hypothetical protein
MMFVLLSFCLDKYDGYESRQLKRIEVVVHQVVSSQVMECITIVLEQYIILYTQCHFDIFVNIKCLWSIK